MPHDDARLKLRIFNICSLGGVAAVVITLIGWLIAGLLPLPLGPANTMQEVVDFYTTDTTRRMFGFMLSTLGVCFALPLIGIITMHMQRMERRLPVLSMIQLCAGAVTVMINLLGSLLFAVLTFRPELRTPESTMFLNDLTWLIFFTPIMPFIIQNLAIGAAVLTDRGKTFPRWVGYVNIWVACAFVPDIMAYFFFSGPFAWDGVFVFWLALTAYAAFLVVMTVVTRRANAALVEEKFAPAEV
ncbi:hypothetical protein [Mycolicibacterium sp. P9-22]|uniref:hypothetical protein n=1 Tax=Mycolicibacterium sp. P9-22 TaxID=2024613 RepID=UPI001D146B89|nr:hypothetical protein [Mycolicibacterium sp. P9-22]